MGWFFHILIAFLIGTALAAHKAYPMEASRLETLKATGLASPELHWAVGEVTKLEYQQGLWNDFFAHAQYLREAAEKDSRLIGIRLLEVLAYLRHCHWNTAKTLAHQIDSAQAGSYARDVKSIQNLVGMLQQTGLKNDQQALPSEHEGFVARRGWFPVRTRASKLNPFLLKKTVNSECSNRPEVTP